MNTLISKSKLISSRFHLRFRKVPSTKGRASVVEPPSPIETFVPNKYTNPWEAIKKAKEELIEGEYQQASEKAWLAADIASKKLAKTKKLDETVLFSHDNKGTFIELLATSFNKEEIDLKFGSAELLHQNYYSGTMNPQKITKLFGHVEGFIRLLEGLEEKKMPADVHNWFGEQLAKRAQREAKKEAKNKKIRQQAKKEAAKDEKIRQHTKKESAKDLNEK